MDDHQLTSILDSQKEILQKLDVLTNNIANIHTRVSVIESRNGNRVEALEDEQHRQELRIHDLEGHKQAVNRTGSLALDSVLKVIWTILGAWIAYHMGIRLP